MGVFSRADLLRSHLRMRFKALLATSAITPTKTSPTEISTIVTQPSPPIIFHIKALTIAVRMTWTIFRLKLEEYSALGWRFLTCSSASAELSSESLVRRCRGPLSEALVLLEPFGIVLLKKQPFLGKRLILSSVKACFPFRGADGGLPWGQSRGWPSFVLNKKLAETWRFCHHAPINRENRVELSFAVIRFCGPVESVSDAKIWMNSKLDDWKGGLTTLFTQFSVELLPLKLNTENRQDVGVDPSIGAS